MPPPGRNRSKTRNPTLPEVSSPTYSSSHWKSDVLDRVGNARLRSPDWTDLAARMQVGVQAYREVVEAMAPYGWLISHRYTPRDAAEFRRIYAEHGPIAVEDRLISDFRRVSALGASHRMTGRRAVVNWASIITLAATAHDRGEYPLAIPIWLITTDGVAGLLGIEPYSIQSPTGKRAEQARRALKSFGSIAPAAAAALIAVFTGLGGYGSDLAVLNRHAVLHGRRPMIGTERESIQCFLALEMLINLLKE